MNDENKYGWISVKDSLPKIGEDVEVTTGDIEVTTCGFPVVAKLLPEEKQWGFFKRTVYGFFKGKEEICVSHWRPIPEKRPDFSKLKKRPDFSKLKIGDLIYIEMNNLFINYNKCGYVKSVDNYSLITASYQDLTEAKLSTQISRIKKITRINLENKTFEEI
jgi:hypothetical protein